MNCPTPALLNFQISSQTIAATSSHYGAFYPNSVIVLRDVLGSHHMLQRATELSDKYGCFGLIFRLAVWVKDNNIAE